MESVRLIQIGDHDLWLMLMSTLRYAMGRRSYITGSTAGLIKKYAYTLNEGQLQQVQKEVIEEIQRANALGHTLGDQMDEDMWRAFISWTEDELQARRKLERDPG